MIIFSNFRKEQIQSTIRVACDTDITVGSEKLPAEVLWISTDIENGYFLNEHICDGYLVAAMAFGMYYGQDVKICGRVSMRLYTNIMDYVQQILINHDPGLHKINIIVDGFLSDEDFPDNEKKIGAPCSFGVDALSTLYDRWLNENDKGKKVNCLFSFNCGINGAYEDVHTKKLWRDRDRMWKRGSCELGIPIVSFDTNIHQYLHNKMYVYAAACYLSRYFCILNLQGGNKKYYLPSEFSYQDTMDSVRIAYKPMKRGMKDIGLGFEEPLMIPLLSTEHLELVLDGAQYQRTQKTERISDWEFAHKYLNVCQPGRQLEGDFSKNCSICLKCNYTMFCLDAMGKLDKFTAVFDVEKYHKNKFTTVCELAQMKGEDVLVEDVLQYAAEKGVSLPSKQTLRKLNFYRWRFSDIDSYIMPIYDLCQKHMQKNIIVWGTGMVGSRVLAALDILSIKAENIVDTDKNKQGNHYFGYEIKNPKDTVQPKDAIFVCGIGIFDEVQRNTLKNVLLEDVYEYVHSD